MVNYFFIFISRLKRIDIIYIYDYIGLEYELWQEGERLKIIITIADKDREGNSLSTNGVMVRIAKYLDSMFNIENIEVK